MWLLLVFFLLHLHLITAESQVSFVRHDLSGTLSIEAINEITRTNRSFLRACACSCIRNDTCSVFAPDTTRSFCLYYAWNGKVPSDLHEVWRFNRTQYQCSMTQPRSARTNQEELTSNLAASKTAAPATSTVQSSSFELNPGLTRITMVNRSYSTNWEKTSRITNNPETMYTIKSERMKRPTTHPTTPQRTATSLTRMEQHPTSLPPLNSTENRTMITSGDTSGTNPTTAEETTHTTKDPEIASRNLEPTTDMKNKDSGSKNQSTTHPPTPQRTATSFSTTEQPITSLPPLNSAENPTTTTTAATTVLPPCIPTWSEWSAWSGDCSRPCGLCGNQTRTRVCTSSCQCSDHDTETEPCGPREPCTNGGLTCCYPHRITAHQICA